jgi:hypothetical protein
MSRSPRTPPPGGLIVHREFYKKIKLLFLRHFVCLYVQISIVSLCRFFNLYGRPRILLLVFLTYICIYVFSLIGHSMT